MEKEVRFRILNKTSKTVTVKLGGKPMEFPWEEFNKKLVVVDKFWAVLNEEEKKRQEEKERLATESNYIGSVGDKIEIDFVSGREAACCETQFGLLHIYEFKDASGNVIVWKSSSSKDIPESGAVTGTVKAHEEYNGVKQTVILRAKITAL